MNGRKCVMVFAALSVLAAAGGCRVPQVGSIPGSGVALRDEREVSGFTNLDLDGFGDVVVHLGEGEYVTIEGDDNIVPDVETIVRNGTLSVGMKRGNYQPNLALTITIGAATLERIVASGAVDLTAERLSGPRFELSVSGAASAEIGRVDVGDLFVTVSGAGDCAIESGSVDALAGEASGAGSLSAAGVECRTATVSASGAGDVRIAVAEDLDASASGAGTVLYSGDPSVRKRVSGAGTVARSE
jgi:hypothetical protein